MPEQISQQQLDSLKQTFGQDYDPAQHGFEVNPNLNTPAPTNLNVPVGYTPSEDTTPKIPDSAYDTNGGHYQYWDANTQTWHPTEMSTAEVKKANETTAELYRTVAGPVPKLTANASDNAAVTALHNETVKEDAPGARIIPKPANIPGYDSPLPATLPPSFNKEKDVVSKKETPVTVSTPSTISTTGKDYEAANKRLSDAGYDFTSGKSPNTVTQMFMDALNDPKVDRTDLLTIGFNQGQIKQTQDALDASRQARIDFESNNVQTGDGKYIPKSDFDKLPDNYQKIVKDKGVDALNQQIQSDNALAVEDYRRAVNDAAQRQLSKTLGVEDRPYTVEDYNKLSPSQQYVVNQRYAAEQAATLQAVKDVGIAVIPVVGTVYFWDKMPPIEIGPVKVGTNAQRVISIGLDALTVLPIGRIPSIIRDVTSAEGLARAEKVANAGMSEIRDTYATIADGRLLKPFDDVVAARNAHLSALATEAQLADTLKTSEQSGMDWLKADGELAKNLADAKTATVQAEAKLKTAQDAFINAHAELAKSGADRAVIDSVEFAKLKNMDLVGDNKAILNNVLNPPQTNPNVLNRQLKSVQNQIAKTAAQGNSNDAELISIKVTAGKSALSPSDQARTLELMKQGRQIESDMSALLQKQSRIQTQLAGITSRDGAKLSKQLSIEVDRLKAMREGRLQGGDIPKQELKVQKLRSQLSKAIQGMEVEAAPSELRGGRGGTKLATPFTPTKETTLVTATGERIKLGKLGTARLVGAGLASTRGLRQGQTEDIVDARGKPIVSPDIKPAVKTVTRPDIVERPSIRPSDKPMIRAGAEPSGKSQEKAKEATATKEKINEKTRQSIGTEPQPMPKEQTKTELATKTAVKQLTKEETKTPIPKLPEPGSRDDKETRRLIKERPGAITFRMGQLQGKDVWRVVLPPGGQENLVTVLGKAPRGAEVYTGRGSAYKTSQKLWGDKFKDETDLTIGFEKVTLTPVQGRHVRITFSPLKISGRENLPKTQTFPLAERVRMRLGK